MNKKIILILVAVVIIAAFFLFDLGRFLNLETLKEQKATLLTYYEQNTFTTILIYFIAYVLMAAFSLPGAAIMTLAGGAIFGLLNGTIIVSFASTIGATLAFLISRTLFHEQVEKRFKATLDKINRGIEEEGGLYLFTLRLVPVFPFFVINLVMGLTAIKPLLFYWVSQLGMLPGTLVYVNAGTQLASVESLSDIVSPGLIASFVLLGLFPLIAKHIVRFIKAKQAVS